MHMFRFDAESGQPITAFGSMRVRMARILGDSGPTHIGCMHLEAGGVVGVHEAVEPQLFLVVAGSGWVRGTEPDRQPIQAGQAAFWNAGELHETGTEHGLTAVVIEGPDVDPARWMPHT